jgi:hypothetical protein
MEAVRSSKTLADWCRTVRRDIPEESALTWETHMEIIRIITIMQLSPSEASSYWATR